MMYGLLDCIVAFSWVAFSMHLTLLVFIKFPSACSLQCDVYNVNKNFKVTLKCVSVSN